MLWFEDIKINAIRCVGEYWVKETEIIQFAKKWDPQPFHIDPQAAAQTEFGKVIASSAHVFSITGNLLSQLEPLALVCGLKNEFIMLRPTFPDDRLRLTIWCISKRLSNSRKHCGIVDFQYQLLNQNDEPVFDGKVSSLVKQRTP